LKVFAKHEERWITSGDIWSQTNLSPREFSESLNELLKLELIEYNHDSGYYKAKDGIYFSYQRHLGMSEEIDHYTLLEDELESIRDGQHKYQTLNGEWVCSQEEVIVANTLKDMGIPYEYEKPLHHPKMREMVLPDFTITWKGKIYYWEHLGMMDDEDYRRRWEGRKNWYYEAGFGDQLITSRSSPNESIDEDTIRKIIKDRFLNL